MQYGLVWCKSWLGRRDSNPRMPVPKTGALPLGDAPIFSLQERHILYNKSVAFSTDRKSLGDISLRGLRVTPTRLAPQAPTSC